MPFKVVAAKIDRDLNSLFPKSEYYDSIDNYTGQSVQGVPAPSAAFFEPSRTFLYLERNSRPSGLGYDFLAKIADKDPLVSAIINTRINQLILFGRPKMILNKNEKLSYSIFPLESESIKEPERKVIRKIEMMLNNTGFYPRPRDNFTTFLKKIIRDRFRYDQVCFEIVHDDKNRPVEFYAVDAASIRLNNVLLPGTNTFDYDKYTFQMLQSEVSDYFKYQDMAFGVFFPKTDIDVFGYGMPEIEQVFTLLSAKIYAEEYNKKFFIQGMGKGFLFAKKALFSRSKMLALQEELRNSSVGYINAHKIPIVSAPEIDDLKYVTLDRSQKDLEFSKYLDYLINLICGVFQIDPSEVNFMSRAGVGGGSILQSEGTYQSRIKYSKDKGLKPLLNFVEDLINQYIVFPLTDMKFMFKFIGLEELSDKDRIENITKEVQYWKTINEVRSDMGLKDMEGGDIILSPTYTQYLAMKAQDESSQGGENGVTESNGDEGANFVSNSTENNENNEPKDFHKIPKEDRERYLQAFQDNLEQESTKSSSEESSS